MTAGFTKTACPYCGVGCGVLAKPAADGLSAEIQGDPEHPANFGRLCSKGSALGETLSLDDRLLHPMISGEIATWDVALDRVAGAFQRAIVEHGPDSVALYVSGQILTEDYYVANKLMKGYIGTANIDTNSRLCMASSVAGHKRAFGSDTVPGTYEDLELADLVVLVGSNLAWCHPVLYRRLAEARESSGTRVVVIDPRATATCEIADLHLPLMPGTDVALFNGLLAHLAAAGVCDREFIASNTSGFEEALATASAMRIEDISVACGLSRAQLADFYELFAATERVVTVYSQGVNQSSSGTDKVNAIINCHLATGRIGKPGAGPFSVTGQPNAMGGREVGGLANMLAAHMELANPDHRRTVQTFWGSPRMAQAPGHKAVDLFEAVGDGRIKALWIMATNPVDSMPEADRVRRAIADCPFVAVSDVARHTDTTALADVLLPALAWGEKDGTVTNSERRISRQRSFLNPPGQARADWWQIAKVAERMGYESGFGYSSPHEIFVEYAALTGADNDGRRDLDLSGAAGLASEEYDELAPFQWPWPAEGEPRNARFFSDGGFFTGTGRANFVPTPLRRPASVSTPRYPLILNTGRIRDQWHTMTRTGKTPRLMSHRPEPFVSLNSADAKDLGLQDGSLARVESPHGWALLRVGIDDGQRRGEVFAPMHWTERFASRARIDALVGANTDPISGQPELKYTPVSVMPFAAVWEGFAVGEVPLSIPETAYHAIAPLRTGHRAELAGDVPIEDWDAFAAALFAAPKDASSEVLTYRDVRSGQFRCAVVQDSRLVAALFVASEPLSVARSWICDQLGHAIGQADRLRLLAGRPGAEVPDKGNIVCSCFEVGANEIADAVTARGCHTVDAVGACLRAGTNCGSCRAEIKRLIEANAVLEAV